MQQPGEQLLCPTTYLDKDNGKAKLSMSRGPCPNRNNNGVIAKEMCFLVCKPDGETDNSSLKNIAWISEQWLELGSE